MTLVLPLFVSVIVCELVLPTVTLPNATLPGFEVKVEFAVTPLPVKVSV